MRTVFIVPVLLLLACDPKETVGTSPAKGGEATVRHRGAAAGAAEQGMFASMSACLESCEHERASSTDRETCRLNCEHSYGVKPAPPGPGVVSADPIGDAAVCMGGCYARSGGVTDGCVRTCKETAAAADNPPSSHALDHLTGCVAACENDRSLKATDRATCELNCAQVARVDVPNPTVHGQAAAVPVQPSTP